MVRPGATTTAEIDAVDRRALRPLRRRAAVHELSEPGSRQAAVPRRHLHQRQRGRWSTAFPNNKPLVEGDIVSVDTGCRLNGWCGDSAVTYPVGRISPDVQRLLDVTLRHAGPGVSS